jgi:hypothetical protein
MNCYVTWQLLAEACAGPLEPLDAGLALDAAQRLGGLARWWLHPEVLAAARELAPVYAGWWDIPPLPRGCGSCCVICVNEQSATLPLLRPAMLLPLEWVPDTRHDGRLPPSLRNLAEGILRALTNVPNVATTQWGLHLSAEAGLGDCDLSGFGDGLDLPSGWVPLAAGLWLRAHGISPQHSTWATGTWTDGAGIGPVDGHTLEHKLALALREPRWAPQAFFVPWRHAADVQTLARKSAASLEIGALSEIEPDPSRALQPYLAKLGAPPTLADPFETRVAYWKLLSGPAEKDYYLDCLLPHILQQQRALMEQLWPGWRPTHFVTIVSLSPELAILGPYAARAGKCLLLHTPELATQAARARVALEKRHICCEVKPFSDREALAPQFERYLRAFLADARSPDNVAFDMTPGKRLMSRTLGDLAPAGSWQILLEHNFRPDRRADPGTEKPIRRRTGEPEAPRLLF